jgi:flagellar biosynthesis component FlhA
LNIREFDDSQIERLELVLFFKNFNFTLQEIKDILVNLNVNIIHSLFQNRMIEINNKISRLNNEKQILKTVLSVLSAHDVNEINVKDFIKEQIYFKNNNERLISMSKNVQDIVIELGESLLPLADKQIDGILIDSIKNLRQELENKHNINFDLIRLRDNLDALSPNEYRILKDSHVIVNNYLFCISTTEQAQHIVEELKNLILS